MQVHWSFWIFPRNQLLNSCSILRMTQLQMLVWRPSYILHAQNNAKCKHNNIKIAPNEDMLEVLIDFFLDPQKELDVVTFTLSTHTDGSVSQLQISGLIIWGCQLFSIFTQTYLSSIFLFCCVVQLGQWKLSQQFETKRGIVFSN